MRFAATILGMALVATMTAAPVRAQAPAPIHTLTYLEVGSDLVTPAANLLHSLRHGMHSEKGVLGDTMLVERARQTRLAILGAFADKAAADAHAASPDTQTFRAKLQPMLVAPPDVRHLVGFDTAIQTKPGGPRAVYILTHVDVIPTFKPQTDAALKALAAASRGEPGCLRFDVLVQDNRGNHFTLVEVWSDIGAFERYRSAPATRDFREKLAPMQGALYDQRIYQAVP
jgi:quinol monooxygenase YgiN